MKHLLTLILTICTTYSFSYAQEAFPAKDSSLKDSTEVLVAPAPNPVPVVVERDDSSDFMKDDFNLYGIIALIIAVFSFVIALVTWIAQFKTEKHTKNVPIKDQREKFKDLSRHEYRNLCCALAAAIRFFDEDNGTEKHRIGYPSESNLQKLKVEPDDIVLSIDSDLASRIAEMRLLLRNYNIEIDVASNHLAKQNISDNAIYQDFDNILFKPMYLIRRAYELEIALVNRSSRRSKKINNTILLNRTMATIFHEHLSKVRNSLSRYADDELHKYSLKMGEVDGYIFPFADHRKAIKRSLLFLLRDDNNSELHTILELTEENYWLIEDVLKVLEEVRQEKPDVYSHLIHYEEMLDSIKKAKKFDFMSFFPTMLALDAVVETVNIGMVNYE